MICPVHKVQAKLVPAGISKKVFLPDGTGKPYTAFWACPIPGCKAKPLEAGTMTVDGPAIVAAVKQSDQTFVDSLPDDKMSKADWAKQGEQKNRSNIVASALSSGKPIDWKEMQQAEAWVISGKTPEELGEEKKLGEINVDDIPF